VRPKHVLIEFKKWMCYIDGQKNKYSVLNECNRMLKYNIKKRTLKNVISASLRITTIKYIVF
jgi:hypothetical protein